VLHVHDECMHKMSELRECRNDETIVGGEKKYMNVCDNMIRTNELYDTLMSN
jgi:hypothetical protein